MNSFKIIDASKPQHCPTPGSGFRISVPNGIHPRVPAKQESEPIYTEPDYLSPEVNILANLKKKEEKSKGEKLKKKDDKTKRGKKYDIDTGEITYDSGIDIN